MNIFEQDIFSIIGLEVTEEERLEIESGLYHAAVIDFLDNYLEAIIGKDKLDSINAKYESENLTFDQLNSLIENEVKASGKTLDEEIKVPLNKVYAEFIQDQIDMLEQKINEMESNDNKVIKQSLLRTLKEMFSNKEWDQMGELFKRVDLYKAI